MPRRAQKGEKLEISFAQKNKWSKDWMQYWFYVRTGGMSSTGSDGKKNTRYPLASVMTPMRPLTQGTPDLGTDKGHEACNRALALACRYSGGPDLVEEMVVANCWPLDRNRPTMTIEMVSLPMFGEGVRVPFPHFGFEKEGQATKKLVKSAEVGAREILGEMSDREYLAHRAIAGMMPWLNRVFEEFGIHHEEHDVPVMVHKSIEDKARKTASKNVTTVVEARKRKGATAPKVITKR